MTVREALEQLVDGRNIGRWCMYCDFDPSAGIEKPHSQNCPIVVGRYALSAHTEGEPDECARCGAAVCRGAKLRAICEDCLPLAPVKYWKDGAIEGEQQPNVT